MRFNTLRDTKGGLSRQAVPNDGMGLRACKSRYLENKWKCPTR
jgi:hypothetical protein